MKTKSSDFGGVYMYKILLPGCTERAYRVAAEAFQTMYEKVTGTSLEIISQADSESDMIVIGSDAVNDFTAHAFAKDWIDSFGIRYGTDDYAIRSVENEGHTYLFLAGGRGRSTIYAVYDYFERAAGCHYYWDGDVIPRHDVLPLGGFDITEKYRFEYRGLRYFAHRGLHRYQAELWSLDDWKHEIDWMVKRRLNYFMLRIGMDDIWQRAFPDIVPYPNPTERLPEAEPAGYDDRTLFWPLEYRSMLRKKLLEYAFERDLMHSEDCGTMTHWYSRTPLAYLEAKKPVTLTQSYFHYSEATGQVFDPRIKSNMDDYFHLTETYVDTYGKPELFHTIGLAERDFSHDHHENQKIKLFTYRRIAERIHTAYPTAKLMYATWDFMGSWQNKEIGAFLRELDPNRDIILDYTSEIDDDDRSFLGWEMIGKFPWIFGLFHAYECMSDIRGPYPRSDRRLKVAADDPYCKGMIFWPELSHSDTFLLEYLVKNAWKPLDKSADALLVSFCGDRYGEFGTDMLDIWQTFWPLLIETDWGGYCRRQPNDPEYDRYGRDWSETRIYHTNTLGDGRFRKVNSLQNRRWKYKLDQVRPHVHNAVTALERIAAMDNASLQNAFVRRDMFDIARTLVERRMCYAQCKLMILREEWENGADTAQQMYALMDALEAMWPVYTEMILADEELSMYHTLVNLDKVCPVNPEFELALKHNLVNEYCRQPAWEPSAYLYPQENKAWYDWMRANIVQNNHDEWEWTLGETADHLYKQFMDMPLAEMQPVEIPDFCAAVRKAAVLIDALIL